MSLISLVFLFRFIDNYLEANLIEFNWENKSFIRIFFTNERRKMMESLSRVELTRLKLCQ